MNINDLSKSIACRSYPFGFVDANLDHHTHKWFPEKVRTHVVRVDMTYTTIQPSRSETCLSVSTCQDKMYSHAARQGKQFSLELLTALIAVS